MSTILNRKPVELHTKFWNGDPRPTWDLWGVKIEGEDFYPKLSLTGMRGMDRDQVLTRPTHLEGIVIPVTTTGRPGAPDPQSGLDLTSYAYDRGHLIGLELGGPDVEANIAPQWANYQRTQIWRKMEREVRELALAVMDISKPLAPSKWGTSIKAPDFVVQMTVDLAYGREPTVPNAFRVVLKKIRMADLAEVVFGDEAGSFKGQGEIVFQMENEPDQRDLNIVSKLEDKLEMKGF